MKNSFEVKVVLGTFGLIIGIIGINFFTDMNKPLNEKVVELHITRKASEEALDTQFAKGRKFLKLNREYICSGGFITPYGDIITAKHCTENTLSIDVITSDNQSYHGTILATSTLQDLAIIHIERRKTPYFSLASSVYQGENISTLGSPLAFTATQSWGKVAKVAGDLLFMDESVLPGNSGGVVFNGQGKLVGVAVSVAIVGMGVTHLAQAQSLDSVIFFLKSLNK